MFGLTNSFFFFKIATKTVQTIGQSTKNPNINNKKHQQNMQVTVEKKTSFYDRLSLVKRMRFDGRCEQVGGNEGGVKLRIIKTQNVSILTLHLASSLVASASIQKFDIVHISEDGYSIHLYLNEYSTHRARRKYIFHFSNDEIALKNFFDTYILALPPDLHEQCPSYFDLRDRSEAQVEISDVKNKNEKKKEKKEIYESDDDKNSVQTDRFDCRSGENDGDITNDSAYRFYNESTTSEVNLDEGFFESQDVYADNCLITLYKR